jgi:hypothetical protein
MLFEKHRLVDNPLSKCPAMPKKKYLVKLNDAEYEQLQQMPLAGKSPANFRQLSESGRGGLSRSTAS